MNTGNNMQCLSWDETVAYARSRPEFKTLIQDAYLDEDPLLAASRFERSEEFQAILVMLETKGFPSGKLLDLGAGNGILSFALAKSGYAVTALEPDGSPTLGREAIASIAKRGGVDISILEGWGEDIPMPNCSMDIVVARQVLHHAVTLDKMCLEIYRVLRPKGLFLAFREHVISTQEDKEKFLNKHPFQQFYGGENAFLLKEYLSAIKNAGFKQTRYWGPYETPINYAPLSSQQLQMKLARKIPFIPTRCLNENTILRKLICKILNSIVNIPGRLYSFSAIKQ